ncbi:MAG: GntR family transcriptional regulator [Microbacteriaceae bacterium]|nr:GntR family transcriptional regulator [Microbacteriaceae bacterium]
MARRGKSETLSTAVRERLRQDILSGQWLPGEKLQLAALSIHYETSSTVVREALTHLTGERLIDLKPNRGFFVPTLSLAELRDFNELRCIAEEFGIRLAIERGDLEWESEVFAALHTLERTPRHDEAAHGGISQEWVNAHNAFHEKLMSSCGVPMLIELSAKLSDANSLYRRWTVPTDRVLGRDIDAEHRDIVAAVIDRDPERAGALLRDHYTRSMELILESGLLPEADPDAAGD